MRVPTTESSWPRKRAGCLVGDQKKLRYRFPVLLQPASDTLGNMSDVTRLLEAAADGDRQAASDLLPLVYDELRRLAAVRMGAEVPGHTLQPTALVHEAYIRLIGGDPEEPWDSRGHFFAAAAEAMRRILIDRARHKQTGKAGGGRRRLDLNDIQPVLVEGNGDRLLTLDEALRQLEAESPRKATLVKLRFFAGLTAEQAAAVLGISASTAEKDWAYSRSLAPRGDQPHIRRYARPTGKQHYGSAPISRITFRMGRAPPPAAEATMTASLPDNEAIFHAARDIADPDRRREYVREACGPDETRIAHVEALLGAADTPDSLLDGPARGDRLATIDQPTTDGPGTVIGPYKLLQQIGEGGMGTVFMAEQTHPVRRKVALKIIKPGMDSRQVIARFEAERQALALMDHVNIARVFDAGDHREPAGPTSSWSWSTACRSPSTATTTT